MPIPTSLREVACSNQRTFLAHVIRSYRRTGQSSLARRVLHTVRERGAYPSPVRAFRSSTATPFAA